MTTKTKPKSISEKLPFLLKQREGTSLEFKREMYQIGIEGEGGKRQKGELAKDIIALANGNTTSVGEVSYLIIGADNELFPDGKREIFNVENYTLTESNILNTVNSYIEPKIVDIKIEKLLFNENNVVVISIPSSPHLYETVKILQTPDRSYSEYTVFIRQNEQVRVASTKEREGIRRLKEIHFAEKMNPSPIPFGAFIGAITAALFLSQFGYTKYGTIEGQVAGALAGLLFGAVVGGVAGSIYRDLKEIIANWRKKSRLGIILASIPIIITLLIWYLTQK